MIVSPELLAEAYVQGRKREGQVHAAGLESLQLGRGVTHRLEGDLVELGRVGGIPVVGVFDDGYVVAGNPFLEHERAGADHILALGQRALGVLVVRDRGGIGVGRLQRGRALNAEDLKVEASRKFDCGVLSVITTVLSSGAATEAMLEAVPKPPKTAP